MFTFRQPYKVQSLPGVTTEQGVVGMSDGGDGTHVAGARPRSDRSLVKIRNNLLHRISVSGCVGPESSASTGWGAVTERHIYTRS